MNVKLNIEEDKELRDYIKNCIKGQVLSITREDFVNIVTEEIERRIKGTEKRNFDYMLQQSMTQAINNILYKEHGVSAWGEGFINPIIEKYVTKAIQGKDWNKMVDELAKQKVKALIK
jgi:hypothetical protein